MLRRLILLSIFVTFISYFSSCSKSENDPNVPDSVAILQHGLAAYFPFTGNASDASGNHVALILHDPEITADRDGNNNSAYYFDADSYFEIPSIALETRNYTYAAWTSVATLPFEGGVSCVISIGQDSTFSPRQAHQAISLANDYGTAHAAGWNAGGYNIGDNPTTSAFQSAGLPAMNEWHYIVSTRSDSQIALYIDGKLIGSTSTNNQFPDYGNVTRAIIGNRSNLKAPFFGTIDEVRIYNRALSPAEVSALYWTSIPKSH